MDKIATNVDGLTHKIIGCAMQVNNTLGNSFPSAAKGLPTARQEVIYQRAWQLKWPVMGFRMKEKKKCLYITETNKL